MNFKQRVAQIGVTKIFLMLLLVVLFSYGVYAYNGKNNYSTIPNMQRGHISPNNVDGLNVTWKHVPTYNLTKQEFILDVSQTPGNTQQRTISPSLYLSDTSFNLTKLNASNLEITAYGYQAVNKYSTLLGSCSQSTQTIGNGTNATTSIVWNYPNFCTYTGEWVYKSYNGSLYNYNAVTVIYNSVMIGSGNEPVADSMFKKSKMMKHQNGKHSRVGHIQLNQILVPSYKNNINSHKYLKIIINNIPVKRLSTGGISTTGTFFVRINGVNYWDKTHSSGWNNTFLYKEQINFTANVGQFSYLETIPYSANMNSDFSDIRFVDTATETTEYNYTIESYTASTSAIVRIYSQGASSVMMYYGNSGATTTSSASDTYFNPVSYYYLDGNVNDALGVNNGTNNGATSTTGKIGTAYSFSGTTNIWLNSTVFDFTPISVGIWANLSTGQTGGILSLDRYRFRIDQGSTGDVIYTVYDGAAYEIITTPNSYTGWHYIVVTLDSGTMSLYVDGILIASQSGNVAWGGLPAAIGSDGDKVYWTGGTADEVGIWNKALTSTQISELYQQTAPTFTIGAEQVQFACNFNGTVKDENGVAISSARVVLMNASSDDFVTNTTTDINGLWSVGVNSSGNYSVYAYQPGNFTRPGDIKVNIKC